MRLVGLYCLERLPFRNRGSKTDRRKDRREDRRTDRQTALPCKMLAAQSIACRDGRSLKDQEDIDSSIGDFFSLSMDIQYTYRNTYLLLHAKAVSWMHGVLISKMKSNDSLFAIFIRNTSLI